MHVSHFSAQANVVFLYHVCYLLFLFIVVIMAMKMSRKRKASLRKRAEEMNEAKSRAKLVRTATTESTIEGPSTIVLLDSEDLPAPIAIEECNGSEDEDMCDEDYKGMLTSEDTAAIYSDWISNMERVDKQKMAMMLYDNYVEQLGLRLQKTEAAREVGLFLGVNDKTVRLWRSLIVFVQWW